MNEQERTERIIAMLRAEEGLPPVWWWLTFFEPEGGVFLGAACILASGMATANLRSHKLGINVAGSAVAFARIPESMGEPPDEIREKLVSSKDDEERIATAWMAS